MTSKKILLVEDDPFLVRVYKLKLEKEGFEAKFLGNGVEAQAQAKEWQPNLMVLDLVMPEKDGFEVLKEMKADASTKEIPILVLSALQTESDVEQGKKLGADKYLTKANYTFEQVISEIKALLTK